MALTLPVLIISMDATILGLAVPSLSEMLEPSSSQLLWVVDIYSFVLAGLLVTMGSLGDRVGRRKLLMIGAAGFSLASVVAAFSTSPEMLIAARAMLGVAGATIAQDKTELTFSAVFSQQDIRAEMMEKFKEAVADIATIELFSNSTVSPITG